MSLGWLMLGLLSGMLYGLLAVGLVLVYRANKFLNLAHGQLGALSALILAKLCLDSGWSYAAAFPVALAAGVATGVVVERLFIRRMRSRSSSTVSVLLLTLGVSQLLLALVLIPALQPDATRLQVKGFPLPVKSGFTFGGVIFGGQYVLILILVPTLVAAIALFLRYTVLGKMIRAAAVNPDAARLCGISPARVSAVTWGIAGALSAVSAILQAPSQASFDATALGPEQLFVALGAAAFGAFSSIPMALLGGLTLGVVEQVTIGVTSNDGTALLVMFAVVLVVVLLRGGDVASAFATRGAAVDDRAPARIPGNVRDRLLVRRHTALLRLVGIGVGVLLPLLPGLRSDGHRFELSLILIYAVVAVSLTMLVGWGGQLSLGHFAVLGMGAFVAARLASHGVSLPVLVVAAGAAGAVVLTVVGIPALRVRGLTLAVTTLGFALVANEWLFRSKWFTGSVTPNVDLSPTPVLRWVGSVYGLLSVYYLSLVILVAVMIVARALRGSTPGRLMIAVRDDERASATFGVTPSTVKLMTLAISGFFAGAAGVAWGLAWRTVSPDQFTPDLSLSILALPVIGGLGSASGAVGASFLIYASVFFLGPHLGSLFGSGGQAGAQLALSGLLTLGVLLAYPSGIAGAVQDRWERILERLSRQVRARGAAVEAAESSSSLDVNDVTVTFGGIRALDGASIRVERGEIVGLIGPNGAGKSTLLNVITGLIRADSGSVWVDGHRVDKLPTDLRSGYGLGRSFQAAHLFPGLTVRETVQAVLGARRGIGAVSSMVRAPWVTRAERGIRAEADALIERTGLAPWADTLAADLSTGTRRICDLTLQIAARPRFLLLDEPTAGVAQRDAEAFAPLLRAIREDLGCAIVIVEHDVPLLMGLCDRVYALDLGRVIAEGPPAKVRHDPQVIASYLGVDEAAINRSGARASRPRRPASARSSTPRKTKPVTAGRAAGRS
ncbi:MAG TPA: ATP-binding cassette domain-containing protein [Mycobacteriales bacterium]|nr:ATP-binding cassette domain-containing protein [Mycobacteriales bacterium]